MEEKKKRFAEIYGWIFERTVPLQQLSRLYNGGEDAPTFYRVQWRSTRGLTKRTGVKVLSNPRTTLEGVKVLVAPTVKKAKNGVLEVALSENLHGSGGFACAPPSRKKNKKIKDCGVQSRWVVFRDELNTAYIYIQKEAQSHGPGFCAPSAMPMTPALRQWLRQMDGQGAKEDGMKGRGGAMTAHELQQLLLGGACELVKDARDVPTVQEIATVIHNGRKKLRIGKKGQTRAEALQEALNRPELASTILFPPLESRETYILDRTAAHRPWMIFLIAPYAVTVLQRWGKDVVGLDSIYKLSKSHHPVWALVVQDDLGRSWPVAFAVASKERAAVVRFFLSSVRHFFETQTTTIYSPNTTWQPFVMIDKDKVERNGATSAGFQVLLCDFHTQQLWRKKVAQYGKDDGSVLGLLKRLQHAMTEEAEEEATKVLQNYCQKKRITRFWKYFDKNWLSPPWASTWKSIGRPGHREGLWNTNNATETIFRSVLRDFHCKGTKGDHNLVLTLADNVFRRYNVELNRINVQQQRPSRGVRRLWRRYQEGLRLAQHQQSEKQKKK
ncbi:hypothetical protein QOT17_005926 [Balamuthia mandrillaris]